MDPANAVADKPCESFEVPVEVFGMNDMVPHQTTGGGIVKVRRASRWDCGPKELDQNSSLELCDRAPVTLSEATKSTWEKFRLSERSVCKGQMNSLQHRDLGECTNSSGSFFLAQRQQPVHQDGDAVTNSTCQSSEMGNSCGWNGIFNKRIPSNRGHTTNRGVYEHHTSRCNGVGAPARSGRNSDPSRQNPGRRYSDRDGLNSSTYASERRNFRNSSGAFGQRNGHGRHDEWVSSESRYHRSGNHFKKDWRPVRSSGNHSSAVNRANECQGEITVQSCFLTEDSVSRTFASQTPSKASFMTLENTEATDSLLYRTAEDECSDKKSEKGGWVYLDNDGTLQGPLELAALKFLHHTGLLKSDHMVKQHMSNEWVTLEHAESPREQNQLQSHLESTLHNQSQLQIFENGLSTLGTHGDVNVVEQHVGVLSTYFADFEKHKVDSQTGRCSPDHLHKDFGAETGSNNSLADFHIDERVDRLMKGFTLIPGREKEIVSEALSVARQMRQDDEVFCQNEDSSPQSHGGFSPFGNPWKGGDCFGDAHSFQGLGFDVNTLHGPLSSTSSALEVQAKGADEATIPMVATCSNATHQENHIDFRQWTLRGGDWKLVYPLDALPQGQYDIGKKVVLNNGQPLCSVKKSGLPDPRKQFQEFSSVIDFSTARMKLDLPPWVRARIEKNHQSTDRLKGCSNPQQTQAHSVQPRNSTSKARSLSLSHPGSSKSEMGLHTVNLRSKSASHACNMLSGSGMNASMEPRYLNQKLFKGAVEKGGTAHVATGNERFSSLTKDMPEAKKCGSISVFPGATWSIGALVCNRNSNMQQAIEHCNNVPEKVNADVESSDSKLASGKLTPCVQVDGRMTSLGNPFMPHSGFVTPKGDVNFQYGDWFYLDGTGHEVGPFSFAWLQAKVEDRTLVEGMSIFRKNDAIWIPLFVPNMVVHNSETPMVSVVDSEVHDDGSSPGPPGVSREPSLCPSQSLLSCAFKDFPCTKWASESGSSDFPRSLQTSQTNGDTDAHNFRPSIPSLHRIADFDNGINCLSNHAHSSALNRPSRSWDVQKVHPSFMGFTRGRLHEFVLRHYKSHLLPATLHECLEAWLSGKKMGETANVFISPSTTTAQLALHSETCSGKVLESEIPELFPSVSCKGSRHIQQSTNSHVSPSGSNSKSEENTLTVLPTNSHMLGDMKRKLEAIDESDDEKTKQRRIVKKRRSLHLQEPGEDSGLETSIASDIYAAGESMFSSEEAADLKSMVQREPSWGCLQEKILSQIYHCFQGDWKTLACAGSTCKLWRKSAQAFKTELKYVDLSVLGVSCTDSVLHSLAKFGGDFTRISLRGCTMVCPIALKHLLHARPSIISVDIIGCAQFQDLRKSFAQIEWLSSSLESKNASVENVSFGGRDYHYKTKSVKLVGEKRGFAGKASDVEVTESTSKRAKLEASEHITTPEPMELDFADMTDQGSQSLSTNDSSKEAKSVNNGSITKLGLESAKPKAAKPKNGSRSFPFDSKGKPDSMSSKTMHKTEGKRRMQSTRPWRADKCISPKFRGEVLVRNGAASPGEGDKLLEELAFILKALMDLDSQKFFFQMGVSDSKSFTGSGRHMDFLTMEKKLKGGYYRGGMDGLKTFKGDLSLLRRNALQLNFKSSSRSNARSNSLAKAAREIYLTSNRMVTALEKSLSDFSPHENQAQGKVPNSILSAKARRKSQGAYSSCNPGLKGHRPYVSGYKGKIGASKKNIKLSSTYSDAESDFGFTEPEGRRFTERSKNWSDSDTEISDEDVPEDDGEDSEESHASDSEEDDGLPEEDSDGIYDRRSWEMGVREWGARMTKAAMVPPITRKYEVIEDYNIVIDQPEVDRKMTVEMPEDYVEKLQAARERKGSEYSHLDIPELKGYRPRKRLGDEVVEQEVYGIEPYTYNLLMDTMPEGTLEFSEIQRHQFIEEGLLRTLNEEVSHYTGTGKAPMECSLISVVQKMSHNAQIANNQSLHVFCEDLLKNMQKRLKDKYVAYRKGLGVVCNTKGGFDKNDFIVEFLGEVYPAWRWYEKQDAIRSLQKKERDNAPEFYNIMLERPKGDAGGYDLVVVDAMHKANYASRICHSCRPNCEAKVTAVNGRYTIGVYTLRPILCGEELTFDYNSVTESKEEWKISICLCGSQGCRGSYLNLTGAGTFEEVMKRYHGLLDRHHMLLEACADGEVTQLEWDEMRQAGVGTCMLSGLPNWAIKYTARLVGFINLERARLPEELMKANKKKKRGFGFDAYYELERPDAEIQADGVYNNRLQNLAITLDKVRYLLTKLYNEPCKAPPPLRRLESKELVRLIWKGEGSVVGELLHCMAPHISKEQFLAFEQKVRKHDPDESKHVESNLRQSLYWLRDELRSLSATWKCRHDAAADIIHLYACTKFFFTSQDYDTFESPAIFLNSLDLGPRHAYGLGAGFQSWSKTYGKDYVLGQLIYWYQHGAADPGSSLPKARRGCLVLPDVSSCYSKSLQQEFRRGYGSRQRFEMIAHMEERPQKQWPKAEFWDFKSNRGLLGSPMLDAVRVSGKLDPEMLDWLRTRHTVYEGPWDEQ
ncbi:hypothetical protein O6H91_07G046000 [Diphasiastrum complanatum]|nr:hypothetical protein O6H91_07G046000 [Diphasiastrum complanatum]